MPLSVDRELMRMHVEALFTLDDGGRLRFVNDGSRAAAPRFFLGQTRDGHVWRARHDVPDDAVCELAALCSALAQRESIGPPDHVASFEAVLARSAPIERVWTGPAFHFPSLTATEGRTTAISMENRALLERNFGAWLEDVSMCQPFLATVSDGEVVSVCASVRTTDEAQEAGVETHLSHRGRGHAIHAVSAWANAVRDGGRVPLYSTSWQNTASRAVARKLGLLQFGADLSIT